MSYFIASVYLKIFPFFYENRFHLIMTINPLLFKADILYPRFFDKSKINRWNLSVVKKAIAISKNHSILIPVIIFTKEDRG